MLSEEPEVRLADLILAVSLATDLGLGQPMNHALRSAHIAVRLGRKYGLDAAALSDAYYLALLMFLGCSSVAGPVQRVFGDELRARGFLAPVFLADVSETLEAIQHNMGGAGSAAERQARVEAVMALMPSLWDTGAAQCETAQILSRSLGVSSGVERGLGQVFEMWNGDGVPKRISGEQIDPTVRVVQLAHSVEYYAREGIDAVLAMVRRRAGVAHPPDLVDCFCRDAADILEGIDQIGWNEARDDEPQPHHTVRGDGIDRILEAAADFVDLKSPWFVTHSRGVAELAAAAARATGLSDEQTRAVRRVALVHDLGRVGVSVGIWDKPGPLTDVEWERVRLHAYLTRRMFARLSSVPELANAGLDHERSDGSGYPSAAAGNLPQPARLVAAADVFHALLERRPHRDPLSPEAAEALLLKEARQGRLDADSVRAVLKAAGRRVARRARAHPAGLTEREVEVLRLIAAGLINREMAERLGISAATVDHHIRHIYDKIGVSTRAAATVFAMQNALIEPALEADA